MIVSCADGEHKWGELNDEYERICEICYEILNDNWIYGEGEDGDGGPSNYRLDEKYSFKKYEKKIMKEINGFNVFGHPITYDRDFAFKVYDKLKNKKPIVWNDIYKAVKENTDMFFKITGRDRVYFYGARVLFDLPDVIYTAEDLLMVFLARTFINEETKVKIRKNTKSKRVNNSSISYLYCFYKVLQLQGRELSGIPMKIGRGTLRNNEFKWKRICAHYEWEYIKTEYKDLVLNIDIESLYKKWDDILFIFVAMT